MAKAVLIQVSTQEILKKGVSYPQKEITPIDSLDSDLEWLIIYRPAKPNFNPDTQKLVKSETITQTPHPEYPELNQYLIEFTVVDLTADELDDKEEQEAAQKYETHLERGNNFRVRSYRRIWRRVLKPKGANNDLTKAEGRKLFRWFEPVWIALSNGDFKRADVLIKKVQTDNTVELETTPQLKDVVDWFAELINNYFKNKYDL